MDKPQVFIKKIPDILPRDRVYPKERQDEIDASGSLKVKCEKYWSWKLLELAAERVTSKSFTSLSFEKQDTGRWVCSDFDFSISHSGSFAAVIISESSCGIDIEAYRPLTSGVESKMLTKKELEEYGAIDDIREKEAYLIRKWTKKEAIFKSLDKRALMPTAIESSDYCVSSRDISLGGKAFCLSVFAKDCDGYEMTVL